MGTFDTQVAHPEAVVHERRRYPRIKTAVPVEFQAESATAPIHAETSDISCGGCYIEMNFTLPVGTRLEVTLWLAEQKLMTGGVVVTHHPYFGNGIRFVDMSVEDLNRLNRFLHSAIG